MASSAKAATATLAIMAVLLVALLASTVAAEQEKKLDPAKAEKAFNKKLGLDTEEAKKAEKELKATLGADVPIREWSVVKAFEHSLDTDMRIANETADLGEMLTGLKEIDDGAIDDDAELEPEKVQALELYGSVMEIYELNKKTSEVLGKMWKQYRSARAQYVSQDGEQNADGTVNTVLKFPNEHDEDVFFSQFMTKVRDVVLKLNEVFQSNQRSLDKLKENVPQFVEAATQRIEETAPAREKRFQAAKEAAEKDRKAGGGIVVTDGMPDSTNDDAAVALEAEEPATTQDDDTQDTDGETATKDSSEASATQKEEL